MNKMILRYLTPSSSTSFLIFYWLLVSKLKSTPFHPLRQTHIYRYIMATVWHTSTKKALKGWILGTVGWTQIQSVTNTSPHVTSTWQWVWNREEGGWERWDEQHPHTINSHPPSSLFISQPQVLVTLCELTPVKSPENSRRTQRATGKPQADTCDVGWSHHLLRSFVWFLNVSEPCDRHWARHRH